MYPVRRSTRTAASRGRILQAVRALLEEGRFHETTVEEVAERAGVSRATLYQHFGSRLGLIDGICDSFDENPALVALRRTDDTDRFTELVVEFWSTEERVLAQLYGAAAIDPAARDFVERQRRDRYGEVHRLLRAHGRDEPRLFAEAAVLTSFETYVELRRHAGRTRKDVVATLQAGLRRVAGKD